MKHPSRELPIRLKIEMAQAVASIIKSLHEGQDSSLHMMIDNLKAHALFMDESIQQGVLAFSEQVLFQMVYDPWHAVTIPIENAADQLVEELGFCPPPYVFRIG